MNDLSLLVVKAMAEMMMSIDEGPKLLCDYDGNNETFDTGILGRI
jgi:hypothetical protein